MLDQGQQFDDCFQIDLPIKKITEIIFMSSSQLLVLHVPNQYHLFHILNRNEMKILKNGKLPSLIENITKINQQCIAFILENQLHVFNIFEEKSISVYHISRSSIYLEQFQYLRCIPHQNLFLFYKTSILKGTPITIYDEIHLISLKEKFEKVKRLKIQHQDLRKFGYSCGEIFSYQLSGYEIEVTFLQSGITHKIQSIFNLFLIDIKLNPEEILMNFTHDELQNQLSTYKITKKKAMRMDRTAKGTDKHAVHNENKLRSLVFKNCFNHRKNDPCVGIFRVKIAKQSKLLHLMENGLDENLSNEFKQMILNLLHE